nr:reticuline oxidase-like protein [Ipomoea batatas]
MKARSGGHDYEGVSYVSNVPFFILDMFNFKSVNVSIQDETAWVEARATLGEVCYGIANKSNVHGFPTGDRFQRHQNATNIVYRHQRVAHKLDHSVVNSTTRPGEKTIRPTFNALFLGDSKTLLSTMNETNAQRRYRVHLQENGGASNTHAHIQPLRRENGGDSLHRKNHSPTVPETSPRFNTQQTGTRMDTKQHNTT